MLALGRLAAAFFTAALRTVVFGAVLALPLVLALLLVLRVLALAAGFFWTGAVAVACFAAAGRLAAADLLAGALVFRPLPLPAAR